MVMQNGRYVTVNFIAEKLSNYQFLFSIFLVKIFCHHPLDAMEALPDLRERGVQRSKTQADIIGCAEVGDNVQFFDEGAVDAISVCMANGDMGATDGRIPRGAEGEAQWRKQV